jgi:hypothetical protein
MLPKVLTASRALDLHGDDIWNLYRRHVDGGRAELEERLRTGDHRLLLFRLRGALIGMAAVRILDLDHLGRKVRVLHLHDVISDQVARGKSLQVWAAAVAGIRLRSLFRRNYLFSDCCNYRAYRAMVSHLDQSWPAAGRSMPAFEEALYEKLCPELCGAAWEPARRLTLAVTAHHRKTSEASAALVERDPHVAFFVRRNPGYLKGEGLPTLARMTLRGPLRGLLLPQRHLRASAAAVAPELPSAFARPSPR